MLITCGLCGKREKFQILAFLSIVMYAFSIMSFTYQPKKRKRARTHGFLIRKKSKSGRNVVKRRRAKGRKKLVV